MRFNVNLSENNVVKTNQVSSTILSTAMEIERVQTFNGKAHHFGA